MRTLPALLLAASLGLFACNNNKTKDVTLVSPDGNTKVSLDPTVTENQADEMTRKMEELKKLTPLTTDQLKAMLPEQLMGLPRTNFNATNAMRWGSATASYRNEGEDKEIDISIFDCAGEAGAGIYSLNYWMKMSVVTEDQNGYSKTVDFNGGKAVEGYNKNSDEHELTFTSGDRLLVTVKGRKTGLDAVKQAAASLPLAVK